MKLSEFEKNIGYTFKDKGLLETALTHSSFLNEHGLGRESCNERIEFLGDAVLELVASDFIYKHFTGFAEGDLSRFRSALVCEKALAKSARRMDLSRFLRLGKGEEKGGGRFRDSVVSDAVEAVIGAVYLDGGIVPAEEFIHEFILEEAYKKAGYIDSKSKLQILSQELLSLTPQYEITGASGPDHQKIFTAEVSIGGKIYGTGTGGTKKQAEQSAAFAALNKLEGTDVCI